MTLLPIHSLRTSRTECGIKENSQKKTRNSGVRRTFLVYLKNCIMDTSLSESFFITFATAISKSSCVT